MFSKASFQETLMIVTVPLFVMTISVMFLVSMVTMGSSVMFPVFIVFASIIMPPVVSILIGISIFVRIRVMRSFVMPVIFVFMVLVLTILTTITNSCGIA